MKQTIVTLLLVFGYHATFQISDYNEAVRYNECTLKTNDYKDCENPDKRSLVYNLLLKLEVPQLHDCVWPGGRDNILCSVFSIKRSK